MYEKTCISAPLGKKIPAGILGKYLWKLVRTKMKKIITSMAQNPHNNPYATCMRKPVSVPRWEKIPAGILGKYQGKLGICQRGCQREELKNQ